MSFRLHPLKRPGWGFYQNETPKFYLHKLRSPKVSSSTQKISLSSYLFLTVSYYFSKCVLGSGCYTLTMKSYLIKDLFGIMFNSQMPNAFVRRPLWLHVGTTRRSFTSFLIEQATEENEDWSILCPYLGCYTPEPYRIFYILLAFV